MHFEFISIKMFEIYKKNNIYRFLLTDCSLVFPKSVLDGPKENLYSLQLFITVLCHYFYTKVI